MGMKLQGHSLSAAMQYKVSLGYIAVSPVGLLNLPQMECSKAASNEYENIVSPNT